MQKALEVRDTDERLDPFTSLPFFGVHIAAIVGAFIILAIYRMVMGRRA